MRDTLSESKKKYFNELGGRMGGVHSAMDGGEQYSGKPFESHGLI